TGINPYGLLRSRDGLLPPGCLGSGFGCRCLGHYLGGNTRLPPRLGYVKNGLLPDELTTRSTVKRTTDHTTNHTTNQTAFNARFGCLLVVDIILHPATHLRALGKHVLCGSLRSAP